ncbi:HlyD family type I secretion periplasmic adaptor subunit [Cellvibrio japonicus]|uniref:Membrane fusion protein (MFP) family protein n=1 Tax=Cellvibrio japonicus (strain Ueda107) TaxID=498211 RepID=B3PD29_CELJU|nr:HlyD family type I secretion periplasmic adaptor subunit [Cellvibrio japonicus]ACE85300.1 HlyD-family secretion protein [Cellvibrio japonicus Ueda107]QEI11964.1 HlyD family type I secretion periplasmic adaptor subunit [Cellvibrio japonicus]QEI15538.1 HlyD family type I secretion periplasmic adaptor subunit [Cellvibrio japonicus]QEI19117.1 HlyD family type I secretion periplasmic adaptor subunit [Cellvibrio japonicus]
MASGKSAKSGGDSLDKRLFYRVGRWLDKLGIPASRLIDRAYERWLDPIHEQPHDWVTDADWARLQQEPIKARLLLRVMALILLLLLVWAAVAEIDEVARGEGKVIPSSQLQVIQSFDGGVVEAVLVHEGQVVEKGDLLLRIDSTRFVSSYRENRAEFLALKARAARLQALTLGTEFTLPEEVIRESADIATHEQRLYETNLRELDEQLAISRSQLEQRQQELNEVRAKLTQAIRSLELTSQELKVTRPLLASGAISEVEILRLEGEVARARGDKEQSAAQESRLILAVQEAEVKLRETELNTRNKWRAELSDVLSKAATLGESGTGLADRIKYAEIRAPVRGTIQRIYTNTLGGVVQPGREVIEMVPLDDQLLVEAKVSPRDIAFLHPGQEAIVKFTAYDFVVYGGLKGKVELISPDAITDEKERTFYIVRVRTERAGFDPALPIMPGMMTQVDILTGKKTVLSYLLKPVLRAKQNALSER